MLSDDEKLRLQAGFDGELSPAEWQRLQAEYADSEAAMAYLAELQALQLTLTGSPEPEVPADLAGRIKILVPETDQATAPVVHLDRERRHSRSAPSSQWLGGLALAASFLLALGLGLHLTWEQASEPQQMQDWMTGSLLGSATVLDRRQVQWDGLEARAVLLQEDGHFALDLELVSPTTSDLLLQVDGDRWRWSQAAGTGQRIGLSAAGTQLYLAVNGAERFRLPLEPVTMDGEQVQDPLPAPRITLSRQRDGQAVNQLILKDQQ